MRTPPIVLKILGKEECFCNSCTDICIADTKNRSAAGEMVGTFQEK